MTIRNLYEWACAVGSADAQLKRLNETDIEDINIDNLGDYGDEVIIYD